MAREHDWSYGTCRRCGHCTDLAGGSIEDAPPCDAYDDDLAERIFDVVTASLCLGIEVSAHDRTRTVAAIEALLAEL